MALAIGFNLVLRDTRLPIWGIGCFCTRTVLTFTLLGLKGGIGRLAVGMGLTTLGITSPCLGLRPPTATGGGTALLLERVITAAPVPARCGLGALTFFDSTFWTLRDRWRRLAGCRREKSLSLSLDSDTATPCDPLKLFSADSRFKTYAIGCLNWGLGTRDWVLGKKHCYPLVVGFSPSGKSWIEL